jgi:type IV pilus assembly protein PilY1
VIAKTYKDGWVVLVANGYNSVSGKGKIYMLNAKTGSLIRTLTTGASDPGTPANPSGLAQLNGFTEDFHNQFIEQVYAGDLNGNVWRWDLSKASAGFGATLFAQLVDPSGTPQPVTTAPQIEIDLNNGNDRWVFVGTGRLLHPNDLTKPLPEQIQTMYAMRDGSLSTPATWATPLMPRVKPKLRVADPLTTAPLAGAVPDGWLMDMPLGQRIVIDAEADLNVVAWIATSVQPDPCLTSLPAYIYAREYATAESDIQTFNKLTGKWTTVASAYSATGAVGLDLIAFLDPASSFPSLGIGITQETSGVPLPYKVSPKSFGGAHRMSWRMLGN